MTPRRLRVLIEQLPATSRTKARLAGDLDGNRWGSTEHLLASINDRLDVMRIEARVIGGDKKPPTFQAMERPAAAARAKAAEAAAEQRARDILGRRPKREADGG